MESQLMKMAEESLENIRANFNSKLDYINSFGDRKFSAEMESIIEDLENSQIKLAERLGTAFSKCDNNMRLYNKVNSHTSHARGLHERSVSLIKKFIATSYEITQTIIPLAKEAADMEEIDSIIALFSAAITCARDMEEPACGIKDSYADSIKHLRETIDFEYGEREKKYDFRGDLKEDIKRMKKEVEEVEEEHRQLEENEHRPRMILRILNQDETGIAHNPQRSSDICTRIFNQLCEWCRRCMVWINAETQQANTIPTMEERDRLKNKKQSIESQINILEVMDNLEEVLHYLEKTFNFLKKLTKFWGDIAVELSHMINGQCNGLSPLESLLNEQGSESFMCYCQNFKKEWNNVREIYTDYVKNCESNEEHSIKALYSFTSSDIQIRDDI